MKRKYWIAIIVSSFVFICDQVTKHAAYEKLSVEVGTHRVAKQPVDVISCCFHFKYVENKGAAWGLLRDMRESIRGPFFIIVSIAAIIFIFVFFVRLREEQMVLSFSLSFILGGALGNFIDRIRHTYVVDFIDWHYYDKFHWPTFNLADSAITLGVFLLLVDMIFEKKENKE